jgi:glyoxylase-like metal-dependent hydrolase (beta-lactamase superfamily II)
MALQWQYFSTDLDNLFRTPILIEGDQEAMLVDGGFTLANGRMLLEKITKSGKKLTTIVITCADPDYYFGLGPVREAFPYARIIAMPEIAKAIQDTVAHKIEVWKPQLGSNAPQSVAEAVLPAAYPHLTLDLEGERIDIIKAKQPNRYHLWVPSLAAILGGVQIVSGVHVWMADTPTRAERDAWIASLDDMLAHHAKVAIPGHMAPGSASDSDAIKFTRDYLVAFDQELPKARDAAALIAAMLARYPDLLMDFVLELGAKVCKGEAQWP